MEIILDVQVNSKEINIPEKVIDMDMGINNTVFLTDNGNVYEMLFITLTPRLLKMPNDEKILYIKCGYYETVCVSNKNVIGIEMDETKVLSFKYPMMTCMFTKYNYNKVKNIVSNEIKQRIMIILLLHKIHPFNIISKDIIMEILQYIELNNQQKEKGVTSKCNIM